MLLLFGLFACSDKTKEVLISNFEYRGDNEAGKQLVKKILNRNGGLEEWKQIVDMYGEPLLDYTLFGYGTRYNLHYVVPVLSKESGFVESYVIYEVVQQKTGRVDLLGNVSAPYLFGEQDLEQTFVDERFIYSAFFFKWKQSGLNVKNELCAFAEKLSKQVISIDKNEMRFAEARSYTPHLNTSLIAYWIELNGYLPDGVDAYGYDLTYLKRFFREHDRIFFTSLRNVENVSMDITLRDITIDVKTWESISEDEFCLSLKKFMNTCALDMSFDPGSPELVYQITYLIPGAGSGSSTGNIGGSGNTGGSISPKPDVIEDPSLIADKDIMCIYSSLRDGSAMENMNKMLKRYLDTDALLRVTYKIEPYLYNDKGKEVNGSASNHNGNVVITLNKNKMSEKKALDIAKTIIHETLHAYIYSFLLAEGKTLKEQEFVDTWEVYETTLVEGGDMHHDIMVRGYLDILASTLELAHKDHEYDKFWAYLSDVTEEERKDFYMGVAINGIPPVIYNDYIDSELIDKYRKMYDDHKYLLLGGWCND